MRVEREHRGRQWARRASGRGHRGGVGGELGDLAVAVVQRAQHRQEEQRLAEDPADGQAQWILETSYEEILRLFWEGHDPTQGMRQGNDGHAVPLGDLRGDRRAARRCRGVARRCSRRELAKAGFGEITTEIAPAGPFYYAEPYHQQYLAKNPNGYCGLGGTGVSCPIGLATPSNRPLQ